MAFVGLEDLDGSCEIVVFPEVFRSSITLLQKDATVLIRGKANLREDTAKILAEEIIPLEEAEKRLTKAISIDLRLAGLDLKTLEKLREILRQHPGTVPVHLNFRDPNGRRVTLHSGDDFKVESSFPLIQEIEELVGASAVKVKS